MADSTTPVTPPAQDLQINLEEAPKTEIQPSTGDLSPDTNGSLDLDLDLADAPKDDDRLKTEDQKNAIPVVETLVPEATTEIQAQPIIQEQEIIPEVLPTNEPIGEKKLEDIFAPREDVLPEIPTIEQASSEMTEDLLDLSTTVGKRGNEGGFVAEAIQPEQTIEQATEITVPMAPIVETPIEINAEAIVTPAPVAEAPIIEEVSTPATVMETIPLAPEKLPQDSENNIPQASSLKNDMDIINELEGHGSAGGLSPEAVVTAQIQAVQTPKTFDLDAMLGSPISVAKTTEAPVIMNESPVQASVTLPQAQAFTLPTTNASIPPQAVMQTHVPTKNMGVKVLLFVVMFAGLGFTTFFILKTMYPIEFGNILGGQTQMHASEVITGETPIVPEITETEIVNTGTDIPLIDQTTGAIDTGTGVHESAPVDPIFGELGDLGTTTTPPVQNDISRLTDYATQGNSFLAQGKTMNNNTIIKYGLYISKKATTFLDDIANGKQIDNLNEYFAQFDQYITELNTLVGQTSNVPPVDTTVSPTPTTNDLQGMTPDTGTTTPPQNTGFTSE